MFIQKVQSATNTVTRLKNQKCTGDLNHETILCTYFFTLTVLLSSLLAVPNAGKKKLMIVYFYIMSTIVLSLPCHESSSITMLPDPRRQKG